MIDLDEHRQKLIRARDHLKAAMQTMYFIPARDKFELQRIEYELAQLESKPQQAKR